MRLLLFSDRLLICAAAANNHSNSQYGVSDGERTDFSYALAMKESTKTQNIAALYNIIFCN